MNNTTLKEKWEDIISLCFKLSYKNEISKRVLFHICPCILSLYSSFLSFSPIYIIFFFILFTLQDPSTFVALAMAALTFKTSFFSVNFGP